MNTESKVGRSLAICCKQSPIRLINAKPLSEIAHRNLLSTKDHNIKRKRNSHHSPPLPRPTWKTTKASSSICTLFPHPYPPTTTSLTPLPLTTTHCTPTNPSSLSQLRPPQMLRNQPHHKSKRPRLSPTLCRQSRRERALYGGEPSVCAVRLCESYGRGR
jgi:hypothetical protein